MAGWANGDGHNVQRRKWNLTENSSLENLKKQLAQDGCSELQFDLAKQLLQNEEDGEEVNVESHHQGINWLLRAANQGHEKAIVLLSDCYSTRRGINESNECEVRLCLEMSPAERAARKAARELFLCLSNGESEFITASQLENKMREIYQMDTNNNNGNRRLGPAMHQYLNHRNNSEILTEANLITAAVNYSNGLLPNLNNTICVTREHPDSLNHIPSFYQPLFHPLLFITLLYHRLVERLAALPDLLWQYKLPLLLLVYLVFSKEREILLKIVPTALYLLSIALMVIATFRMLKAKHDFIDFRLWSGLFQHFGRELALYRDGTEAQFLRNNLIPYLYFFVALIVNVMLRPVVKHELLPHAEITIVGLALTLVTAVVFMCSSGSHASRGNASTRLFPNIFILLSLLVNVLAKYPYDIENVMESSWQIFDSLLPGGYDSHKLGSGIELRLNFKALFYLLIPLLLIQIGSCEKWRGIYKYLMPHCVTLSWMQIGMSYAQDSTGLGLLRASAELLMTVLFLPLVGLAAMLVPVLTAVEAFLIDQKVKIVAFVVLATTLIIIYGYLASNRKWSKWLLPIQITLYSVAIFTYVVPVMEKNLKLLEEGDALYNGMRHQATTMGGSSSTKGDSLSGGFSWDAYAKLCQSPKPNKIEMQLRCSLLHGETVRWEGAVKSVEILQVRNFKRDLLGYVYPRLLRDLLTCLVGEPNAVNCPANENCGNLHDFVEGRWKCNVYRSNDYTYLLRMKSSASSTALLTAGDVFGNFTRHLQLNDRIWFEGTLKSKILQTRKEEDLLQPSEEPLVELQSAGCLSCRKDIKSVESARGDSILSVMQTSLKYLLNAIFNPILIFK